MGLFFSFPLNGGLPTPLGFDLDVCQSVVMALNSCICLCVCAYLRVFFQCMCVGVCVCVLSLCPGMPFLHRPHIIRHSTRGPRGCVQVGSVKEREDNTVSNISDADTDREGGESTKTARDLPHLLLHPWMNKSWGCLNTWKAYSGYTRYGILNFLEHNCLRTTIAPLEHSEPGVFVPSAALFALWLCLPGALLSALYICV